MYVFLTRPGPTRPALCSVAYVVRPVETTDYIPSVAGILCRIYLPQNHPALHQPQQRAQD